MKSKRTKACEIPMSVKKIVWERDFGRCIYCGNAQASPVCHYIARSHGGLGIPENIVTLCNDCHREFDQTTNHKRYKEFIKHYLESKYTYWNEEDLVYKKVNW